MGELFPLACRLVVKSIEKCMQSLMLNHPS